MGLLFLCDKKVRWEYMLIAAMVERLGIIVTIAFVMTRISFFRHLIEKRTHVKKSQTLLLILLFGFFGIVGTYTGLIVNPFQEEYTKWQWHLQQNEAIANSRVIGVVVAGLLGGPWIGLGCRTGGGCPPVFPWRVHSILMRDLDGARRSIGRLDRQAGKEKQACLPAKGFSC